MVTEEQLNTIRPEGMDDAMWGDLSKKFLEINKSDNNGLLMNEKRLKDEKVAIKAKYDELTASNNELQEKYEVLNKQLKDNSPDDIRKIYEDKLKESADILAAKNKEFETQISSRDSQIAELQKVVLERDCTAAFEQAIAENAKSGKTIDPSSIPYAKMMILGENGTRFARRDIGEGAQVLADANGKTIARAVDEFFASDIGKRFLVNGNSGGGADGNKNFGSGKTTISRADFEALSPSQKIEAAKKYKMV